MEKAGERGGQKRKGDAPQGSRVTNEKRVYKKPVEADPSAGSKSPSALKKGGRSSRLARGREYFRRGMY